MAGLLEAISEAAPRGELVASETVAKGVAVLPGSAELARAERLLTGEAGVETLYRLALETLPGGASDLVLTNCSFRGHGEPRRGCCSRGWAARAPGPRSRESPPTL